MVDGVDEMRMRREALQIAMQLPTDQAEALRVLSLTEELVRGFLAGDAAIKWPPPLEPIGPRLRLV